MNDLTNDFGNLYHAIKALLVYKKRGEDNDYYIESYDMDAQGKPINGHPLSVKECNALAKSLLVNEKKSQGFLIPDGLMPRNVLHINSNADGCVLWHTPAQETRLLFTETLNIQSGKANVPAMLWRAGKHGLQVFAIKDGKPTLETALYKAPFFNVYADGRVCMGSVRMRIPADCGLENFMRLWEYHFFNSYFSHTIHGESPVKGNIVQLWQHLVKTGEPFPQDKLTATKYQLKNLIS